MERVVREYQQKNQRIVYKKVENKGIAANTNAAGQVQFRTARGPHTLTVSAPGYATFELEVIV